MLQLSGDIPADPNQPIASLDANSILAREYDRLAKNAAQWRPAPSRKVQKKQFSL